jgi:hypothetical protein
MNFLQPWVIYALPIAALPIIIHLIHRRRQRVVEWGAMRFLFERSRLSKGWQKIRHILILLARMAAVAGLVFALSRPMSGGFVGSVTGGGPDTVICLLDRSASMGYLSSGRTRIERSLDRLAPAVETIEAKSWLYHDGTTANFRNLESADGLRDLPSEAPIGARADILGMFEKALAKIEQDSAGRAEIWVCSDLQASDWDLENSRWKDIRRILEARRDSLAVRILATNEPSSANFSVRVKNAEMKKKDDRAEVVLDVEIVRQTPTEVPIQIPLMLSFAGARSVVQVDFTGSTLERDGIRIPIAGDKKYGWGKVEIPADDQPEDNVFYVVWGDDPPREAVVVAEDDAMGRILGLAAESTLSDEMPVKSTILRRDEIAQLDLTDAALLLWQGSLPNPEETQEIEKFVARGGNIIFMPSHNAPGPASLGITWGTWLQAADEDGFLLDTWRDDADLLAKSASGRALPVGKLRFSKYAKLTADGVTLARFPNGDPMLSRITTATGGIYALAVTPDPERSNLATNGIVLIAMVQRALEAAVKARRQGGQIDAGTDIGPIEEWKTVDDSPFKALSTERTIAAGVLQKGDRLVALNRPVSEDRAPNLAQKAIEELFEGLPVVVTSADAKDGNDALLEEIWRGFLILVTAALFLEAILSLETAKPKVHA